MHENHPIRIMIVEDHHIVRAGLAALIGTQSNMVVVAETGDGLDAVAIHRRHQPDITIVDLRLPGLSGVEFIKEIRRHSPGSRFVVLTTYEGDADIYSALKSGAQAYLLKGMFHEELMKTILAVHAGQRFIPQAIKKRLSEHSPADLTARELDVLQLMVQGRNNKEIATELAFTEGTVKWYVNHIFSKLGVTERAQAIATAIQRGLSHLS